MSAHLVKLKLGGEAGDARLNREWELDDEILVVAKIKIAKVAHSHDAKGRLVREMATEPLEAYVVEDDAGADVADLLQSVRAKRQRELDALLGTSSLFDDPNGENDMFGPDGDDG